MRCYVIGFHRGGTHAFAEYLAKKNHAPCIEESNIQWNDVGMAILLAKKDKNFVCQCPGLSHRAEELSKHGHVYWVTRNLKDAVTSMKNAGIEIMAWDIMKDFRTQWPDDPVWDRLVYRGKDDFHCNYVGYYTLLINVKEYFYEKHLKRYAKRIITEEQPYYDKDKMLTSIKPLKAREVAMMQLHQKLWDETYASLCVS